MEGLVRKYKMSLIDDALKQTDEESLIINEHLIIFENLNLVRIHHYSDLCINFTYGHIDVLLLVNKTLNITYRYTDKINTKLTKSPFILKSIVLDLFEYYYPQLEIDRVYLQGFGVVN